MWPSLLKFKSVVHFTGKFEFDHTSISSSGMQDASDT